MVVKELCGRLLMERILREKSGKGEERNIGGQMVLDLNERKRKEEYRL